MTQTKYYAYQDIIGNAEGILQCERAEVQARKYPVYRPDPAVPEGVSPLQAKANAAQARMRLRAALVRAGMDVSRADVDSDGLRALIAEAKCHLEEVK